MERPFNILIAMSSPSTQILVSKYYHSPLRENSSFEKWVILSLGQQKYKMSLTM